MLVLLLVVSIAVACYYGYRFRSQQKVIVEFASVHEELRCAYDKLNLRFDMLRIEKRPYRLDETLTELEAVTKQLRFTERVYESLRQEMLRRDRIEALRTLDDVNDRLIEEGESMTFVG